MENDNQQEENELQNISDMFKMSEIEMIKDAINDITEALQDPDLKKNEKCPEYIFKEEFLPFFKKFAANEIEKKDNDSHTLMHKWLCISGGHYKSVDVVDNKGETLFTVPPVFNPDAVNMESLKQVGFYDMVEEAKKKGGRFPEEGNSYLYNRLDNLPTFLNNPETVNDDLDKWREIFDRYPDQDDKKDIPVKEVPKWMKEELGLDTDN